MRKFLVRVIALFLASSLAGTSTQASTSFLANYSANSLPSFHAFEQQALTGRARFSGNQVIALEHGDTAIFQHTAPPRNYVRVSQGIGAQPLFSNVPRFGRSNDDVAKQVIVDHLHEIWRSGRMWNTIAQVSYWRDVFDRAGQSHLIQGAVPIITAAVQAGLRPYNEGGSVTAAQFAQLALEAIGVESGSNQRQPNQAANIPNSGDHLASLAANLERGIAGSRDAQKIDDAVGFFEREVRIGLNNGSIDNHAAAKKLEELNESLFIPLGFLVQQSPLGLQDQRAFVVYRIASTENVQTDQGNVPIYYIHQVTRFRDGLLRGNPGWSSFFNNYVVVFEEAIEKSHYSKIERVLEGQLPFSAQPEIAHTSSGRLINSLADLSRTFIQKGLGPLSLNQQIDVQKRGTRNHEVEHERRRRALNLQEGDIVHGGIDEQMAELRSMSQGEPFHILAHIIELAAAETEFAWDILSKLTGYHKGDKAKIAKMLENFKSIDAASFNSRYVEPAYRMAVNEWERENGRNPRQQQQPGKPWWQVWGQAVAPKQHKNFIAATPDLLVPYAISMDLAVRGTSSLGRYFGRIALRRYFERTNKWYQYILQAA
jgi:hypothetical protein